MLIYVLEVGTIRAAACCSVSRISWDTRLPGPAEINSDNSLSLSFLGENKLLVTVSGADQGQRDGVSGRGGVLQGQQRHRQRRQRGERPPQHQAREVKWYCS